VRYPGQRDVRTFINIDRHPADASAISELRRAENLGGRCHCRPCPYLNNIVEPDHRFIKKRIAAALWFGSGSGALNALPGFESMRMIRNGQVRW
jgi:transposase-like protein